MFNQKYRRSVGITGTSVHASNLLKSAGHLSLCDQNMNAPMQPNYRHNLNNMAVQPDSPIIQAKLTVNESGDRYEHQADTVANRVINNKPLDGTAFQPISANGDTKYVADNTRTQIVGPALHHGIVSTAGGGERMDDQTRVTMSNAFGVDFGKVKIHKGDEAAKMSRAINARAFTVGNGIYFNVGEYNPLSRGGKQLLAHELTHTVQQQGNNGHVQREEKKDSTFAPKPEIDFKALPPDLKFRFHHMLFEADTSQVHLDYQTKGMKTSLSYQYGSDFLLDMRKGKAGASVGWTPRENDFKLKLSMGPLSTRFSASPGNQKYGAGLHFGDDILPMQDDISKTFAAGGTSAGNMLSGLRDPGDPLTYYQQHKPDIENVSNSVDLFGKITDYGKRNVRFGADLMVTYDPVNKVVVTARVGARLVF